MRQIEPGTGWRRAVGHVAATAAGPPLEPGLRLSVHFHPDAMAAGRLVVQRLAREGIYRSQFETGTSNGALSAHAGGQRWGWESRLFAGAYDHAPPAQRPKYGSLNDRALPAGGSVRFGSAHLRLAAHVLERTTFCYPDSVFEPMDLGTAAHMPLLALAQADRAGGVVDALDDYVEAHVHGPLVLEGDVEAIVLDPCYRESAVEDAAAALPVATEWHHGFALAAEDLTAHAGYRGQHVVDVAHQVARALGAGRLDAAVIGTAVASGRWDAQDLKRLWHCVARFSHTA